MDRRAFWSQAWEQGRLGFHRTSVHPTLERHAATVLGPAPGRVLVPLCGKTLDLAWLAGKGYDVVGVELVERAICAWFDDNGLEPEVRDDGTHRTWATGRGVTLLQADFLELPDEVGPFDAVWDRAALVALPEALRHAYIATLQRLVRPGSGILLAALGYDQSQMDGPPYAVNEDHVEAYYGPWTSRKRVEYVEAIDDEPRFRERGLTSLVHHSWAMRVGDRTSG